MPATGGLATTLAIMFFSYASGLAVSTTDLFAGLSQHLTPGIGALLGTLIVGLFSAGLRELFVQVRWRMERRDARRKRSARQLRGRGARSHEA